MSILEAAAVRCQTMADGTLRLVLDIEPRNAQAAFTLFGSPGTPVALAALRSLKVVSMEEEEKPKGGPLCQWVAMRCNEQEFQLWLSVHFPKIWPGTTGKPHERAAEVVRQVCEIESRAEIDNDEGAYERFHELIREPWKKYRSQQ